MSRHLAACFLILFGLTTLLPVAAQSPKPDSSQVDASQVFRSFRFVATGTNGQPITDLRPEELQVSDNGKRQRLALSRLLRATPASGPLGPREYSNRGEGQLFASTLLLLDLLNANLTERGATWNETIQALGGIESPENVYLFLLTPDAGIYPVRGWPDPNAPTPPSGSSTPWTTQIRPLLDQALRTVERLKPTDLTAAPGLTAEPTYQALLALARQYAAVPGQKRMIWVSHGMPLTVVADDGTLLMDFNQELKHIGAEFSRLGISLFTVHQQDRSTSGINSQETLQSLPPLTGGRWFENDALAAAITQARIDARATYQAGYFMPAKDADGKVHKLRVSTTRKNVRILAAESYIGDQPEDIARNNLDLVNSRPFDTADIGIRATITPGRAITRYQLHVDVNDLLLQHTGSNYTGTFTLEFRYLNDDGTQGSSTPKLEKVNLTQAQFDAAIKDGYSISGDWRLPAMTHKIRLLVQDEATGIAGSLTVPVGVPSP